MRRVHLLELLGDLGARAAFCAESTTAAASGDSVRTGTSDGAIAGEIRAARPDEAGVLGTVSASASSARSTSTTICPHVRPLTSPFRPSSARAHPLISI